MNLLILDTETSGLGDESKITQLAFIKRDVYSNQSTIYDDLCNPGVPIDIEASIMSHILDEDVVDLSPLEETKAYNELLKSLNSNDVMVVHNIKFDVDMLCKHNINFVDFMDKKRGIDTLRVAKHLYPQFTTHKLSGLLYQLGLHRLEGVRDLIRNAHNAVADIKMLEILFNHMANYLYNQGFTDYIAKMIELTNTPILIKSFTFGKHNGKLISEVIESDISYVQWLINNNDNEDLIYSISYHLNNKG